MTVEMQTLERQKISEEVTAEQKAEHERILVEQTTTTRTLEILQERETLTTQRMELEKL